jgi:hypothetical protein
VKALLTVLVEYRRPCGTVVRSVEKHKTRLPFHMLSEKVLRRIEEHTKARCPNIKFIQIVDFERYC